MFAVQHMIRHLAVATAAAVCLLASVMPDPALAQDGEADPPSRVGRLSQTSGAVSFRSAQGEAWQPAVLNFPVTSGTAFQSEPGSRATLQLGRATLRMDGATQLEVPLFDDRVFRAAVTDGAINVRVHHIEPGEAWQIVTPTGGVSLIAPGRYSIDAGGPDQPARLTVLEGAAQSLDDPTAIIHQDESVLLLSGRISEASPALAQPLDIWADQQEMAAAMPARYVPAELPGAGDLTTVGTWTETVDYGPVWYPPVATDWVPYRHGHWAYVAPWGWTWIDDAPWGFVPFHYGRWVVIGGRWAWIPGRMSVRPVYAPALVTFVGGNGWSAVGWFPLGWQEVYVPWYRYSTRYVTRINIVHVHDVKVITRVVASPRPPVYQHRAAATVIPAAAMRSSRPVAAQAMPAKKLADAPIALGRPPVMPSAETRGASPAAIRAAETPAHGKRPAPAAAGTGREPDMPQRQLGTARPAPAMGLQPPSRDADPPSRDSERPARSLQSPTRTSEPPARTQQPPPRSDEPPARRYDAPARSHDSPARSFEPPARTYEPPARPHQAPARVEPAPERRHAPSYEPPARDEPAPERRHAPNYEPPPRPQPGGGPAMRDDDGPRPPPRREPDGCRPGQPGCR